MAVEDFGVRNQNPAEMKRDGLGVVYFLCSFSWECWVGLFIRRSKLLQVQDEFPDNDRADFGEVGGEAEDQVVVIHMTLRLRIQGRIRVRGTVTGQPMAGDPDSGLGLLEELLLGTWLVTEGIGKNLRHREAILGSVEIPAALTTPPDEAGQAQALPRGMIAQGLVRRQEGNWVIRGLLALQTLYPTFWVIPKGMTAKAPFAVWWWKRKRLVYRGNKSHLHMSHAEASQSFPSVLCNPTRPKCGLIKR